MGRLKEALPQPDLFEAGVLIDKLGTDARKLVRREGPDTSRDAAYSIDTTILEGKVYAAICGFGARGCTSDEVRALPQFGEMAYSSVTARYRALLDKHLIVDTGERRRGASGRSMRVMRKA
jgi:hypothetical protein